MILFRDLFRRLHLGRNWVAFQFGLTLLLILVGIAWTRLPEKHIWQVALSLLLPLLLAISALELQAGTMRRFADDDGQRVKLVWGAITLLVWIAVAWIAWALLNWCDEQIPQWASYLNSQAPAAARAKLLTYEHIYLWITYLEWVVRWIIIPAKVIPYAVASSQCGLRLPWRKVLQLLWDWRWWLGVTLAALLGVFLPGLLFTGEPSGSVHAQILHVGLKLAASYLLAVVSWIFLLDWAAVLFGHQKAVEENDALSELFERLSLSRRWVWAQFGWMLLFLLAVFLIESIPDDQRWKLWLAVPLMISLFVAALVLQAGTLRSLLNDHGKRVRMVWGTLAMLLWGVPGIAVAFLLSLWSTPIAPWVVGLVVAPAILIPFVAFSAIRGLRLPWRRISRVLLNWRWWLGVLAAALIGVAVPALIVAAMQSESGSASQWSVMLKDVVISLLAVVSWILLLGWLAVLLGRQQPSAEQKLLLSLGLVGLVDDGQQNSVKPQLPEND
ncbi:MAG: hypothetical protein ABSF70_00560 [Terracidiphilus sp.]